MGQIVKDIPERKALDGLRFRGSGFGPPFVDFGIGLGATCQRCRALVVGLDEEITPEVVFALHREDHSNTDRAIIGAAGDAGRGE